MKKRMVYLSLIAVLLLLTACTGIDPTMEGNLDGNQGGSCATLDIDAVNEWLNNSANLGEGSKANVVAVIPITHINGPREIDEFYAFVNFKYKARNYIKYQVTYISCTCRSADVNYWQTAYV